MFEHLKKMIRGPMDEASGGVPAASAAGESPPKTTGLRDSDEQFAKLVSGVRDYAVLLLDRQGSILTWNAGAERIKGYRAEEIIGQHFSRFYTNDAISTGWPAHELDVASTTGRFEDEGWRVRQDGSKFWASVVITALRDESGEVRGFLKITRDLTDRRQAEEKLRMSEERFRLLVDGVTDYAIFMLDPQGRVATWNTGAERLKGYQASEIVGQHFSRFYPSEAIDRNWPAEVLQRAMADGRVEDEGWRVRRDGSKFWASVVITALRDESGTLKGFGKVTRDLTQRREAEESARHLAREEAARKAAEDAAEEIERQREQLHVTLASIGDAVIVTDEQARVTFLNPVAVSLTGWEMHEAAGQPLDTVVRIVNEHTRLPVENPVVTVFREKRVVELANHTSLVRRDGTETPIEDSAAPILDRNQSLVGAVMVFRDVTEVRRAKAASQYLAAIVQSSDDAIISQTLDGRIASWNKGAERLYGYAAEEIVGQPLSALVPADLPDELPFMMESIRRGECIEHFETERVRKDGTRVDVSLTISPVKNAEGEIVGASKIARDITARKEEDRRKNEFLALLAHELRNPLAPLRNCLQVMRLGTSDPASVEHARRLMERQLQHLVRLVDDLLDLSRISRGKLELRRERITLATAVEHAIDVCGLAVKELGRELTVRLPDEPLYIDADKTRLAQAICNLLGNASKYSDPGGHIWLRAERQGQEAIVSVKDSGIGIPADMLPKIFDMFVQADRSLEKAQGGLGVGLTIVKRLVEMHGGCVSAHSEGPGHGSQFTIRLPLASPPTDELRPHDSPQTTQNAVHRRILIVDDNRDAATSLAMMLKLMGHEVRTAHDGEAGLAAAAEHRPDLILLDIGMPKLNGYDTARIIRAEPWGQVMTLVAVTGWGQEEDRRKSSEAGFDFHMVKPVAPEELERVVASVRPART